VSIIDAHHHVWDLSVRAQPWIDDLGPSVLQRSYALADLRPAAEQAGVTGTVLVQTVTVAEETPELLALATADPLVAAVVGWVDLTAPAVAADLARLRSGPGGGYLASVRHQVQEEPDPDWLRRPDVLRGLSAVAAAGLCYDLVVRPHQLPAARYAAAQVPGLIFVLDHGGKPPVEAGALEPWATDVRAFAALPNTACKLSGLVTEASPGSAAAAFTPFADVILSAFGAGRVMFGSDWPVCLLASDYAGVLALARALVTGLSEAERAAVFAGTAARVYGLAAAAGEDQEAGGGSWRLPTRPSRRSSR
jgi:L-fuconolactonase